MAQLRNLLKQEIRSVFALNELIQQPGWAFNFYCKETIDRLKIQKEIHLSRIQEIVGDMILNNK